MQGIFSTTEVTALLKVSRRYIELLVTKGVFPNPACIAHHPIGREKQLNEFIEKSLSPGKKVSAKN